MSSAEAAGRLHRQELDAAWRAVGAACARAEAAERRAELVREERVVDDGHLRDRVAFLERRARDQEAEAEDAEGRVASAQERAGQLEYQLSQAHEAAHKALTEAAFMRGVLEESDSLSSRMGVEVMELRVECEGLRGGVRDGQAALRESEHSLELLRASQATLTLAHCGAVGERAAAQEALKASEERAGALAAKLVSAEAWRGETEGRVEGLLARCAESESRGGVLRERVEALSGQLRDSQEQVGGLERRGKERERYVEQMGVEISLLQMSLAREKERFDGVEAGYQRELAAASLRLSASEAKVAGMEVERKHEEARVILLEGALDEREVQVRELEARVRELEEDKEEEEKEGGGVVVGGESAGGAAHAHAPPPPPPHSPPTSPHRTTTSSPLSGRRGGGVGGGVISPLKFDPLSPTTPRRSHLLQALLTPTSLEHLAMGRLNYSTDGRSSEDLKAILTNNTNAFRAVSVYAARLEALLEEHERRGREGVGLEAASPGDISAAKATGEKAKRELGLLQGELQGLQRRGSKGGAPASATTSPAATGGGGGRV